MLLSISVLFPKYPRGLLQRYEDLGLFLIDLVHVESRNFFVVHIDVVYIDDAILALVVELDLQILI
jgi:hypothetical protein